jgi:hypothetical protein
MYQEISEIRANQIREAYLEGSSNIKSIDMACRGDSVYMTVDRMFIGVTEYKIIAEPKSIQYSEKDYKNGLECSHMGVSVKDMSIGQLTAFIGQLDSFINRPKETIYMSICTFNDGLFQVIIRKDNYEVTLEGTQVLGPNDFEFVNGIAPACVFTEYQRIK